MKCLVQPDQPIDVRGELCAGATGVGPTGRPDRARPRSKTELDDKLKKPADGIRKKTPPARKAPARGRYVDEYARPSI
ncbi:MAG: hypothetical protein LDL16_03685 [Thiobacillus sp.]|nr:hypothetical protein [Thiobacillus sp.]